MRDIRWIWRYVVPLALLVGGATAASAQGGSPPPPLSVRVTGEAAAEVPPDQVVIDFGVTNRADTAQRAAAENAQRTTQVLSQVRELAGRDAAIKTVGYSVQPEYRYPREGREPQIAGYTATNVIRVTSGDLAGIGALIDGAVTAGANRVQRIHFSLQDEQAAYADVLRTAAVRARVEAEALASGLGLKLGRILSAVEETSPQRVVEPFRTAAVAVDAATTPVEPGTIEVNARVVLTVEIASASGG